MKVKDLQKWEKNPRTITAERKRILAKTIQQHGDLSGIVYNAKLRRLVSGHMRSEELAGADIEITEEYPFPTQQGTTAVGWATLDGERYAYREVSWDEDQHAAAAIAANRGAGEWDWTKLKELNLELDTGAFDMELTGFGIGEHEAMMTAVGVSTPKSLDYSALDGEDVEGKIQIMANGIRKAIQIEFRPEDFEKAQQTVKYWRDQSVYLGGIILEFLEQKRNEHLGVVTGKTYEV